MLAQKSALCHPSAAAVTLRCRFHMWRPVSRGRRNVLVRQVVREVELED